MPKFLILGIVISLVLAAAGYGIATIQARAIPWDCADWQAFAHDDRTTAILESLAENRGKTLYCGVDQSDTFTKTETWEAGKDRNERDDTVYFGERGSFRGFIAAQEGYLTDGESGVTGQSIDRIFEFPREKKKRRKKKEPYLDLVYGQEYPTSEKLNPGFAGNNYGGPNTGYLVPNTSGIGGTPGHIRGVRNIDNGVTRAWGPNGASATTRAAAQANAIAAYNVSDAQAAEWARYGTDETTFSWTFEVQGGARAECRALGYRRPTRIRWWYFDGDNDGTPNIWTEVVVNTSPYVYRASQALLYTARCVGRYTPPSGG